jgi:subtilisin family serine protease
MNPTITTLVRALAVGAAATATNLATQTIHELYVGLKTLVLHYAAHPPELKEMLAQLEVAPNSADNRDRLMQLLAAPSLTVSIYDELQRMAETLLQVIAVEEKITGLSLIQALTGAQNAMVQRADDQSASGEKRIDDSADGRNIGVIAGMTGRSVQPDATPSVALTPGFPYPQQRSVDPRLQRIAVKPLVEKNLPSQPAATPIPSLEETAQVDLVGQLKDPHVAVPGLHIVRQLGDLFTATAYTSDLDAIIHHNNIAIVQMARPLSPTLAVSLAEIGATPGQLRSALPPHVDPPDGRGVIIGIIDHGCDFAHGNFRNADGSTRILALWHQDGSPAASRSPEGYGYGREFVAAEIDVANRTDHPYETLGYNPGLASHGTHVMDIAAGNGQATGHPGVAPGADIIFVHIGEENQPHTFGNSRKLMEAADYIFEKASALGRPAVINVSLGTHSGPHDGSSLVERWFDQLLQSPNRAIVVSAGNSRHQRAHALGAVTPDAPVVLPWIIRPEDPTDNEVEIWYGGQHRLEVTLFHPTGAHLLTVPRGCRQSLFDAEGIEVVSIVHNEHDARNSDHQISILLDKSLAPTDAASACWRIELRNTGGEEAPFHAWVARDDGEQGSSSFFHPSVVNTGYSLGSISCGRYTITVGSYMAGDPNGEISSFSSAGPTRDGRKKPEVSAPGQLVAAPQNLAGILAAESTTNGATRKSGTSMATPHVTGLIALLMQCAPKPLSIEQIRDQVITTVRDTVASTAGTWHPRYGYGRIDTKSALLKLRGS